MSLRYFLLATAMLALSACGGETATKEAAEVKIPDTAVADTTTTDTASKTASLDDVLAAQDLEMKSRYQYRRPKETLEYFGIKPGMTVAEVLPGGNGPGWYTKILVPYLGENGTLIGVDYNVDMWANFGGFANEEFLNKRKSWAQTWTSEMMEWRSEGSANIDAFALGSHPDTLDEKADVVLVIRALHHLNRFDGVFWDEAMSDIKAVLKPGGTVGIVQHRGPEGNSDEWAVGDNGYLKQSFVIKAFEEAGFELVGEPSELNANPKDQPSNSDMVWRLLPTLATSREDAELKAKMEAIGETDRMTLMFRKP
jgi:predicted methyltransferase